MKNSYPPLNLHTPLNQNVEVEPWTPTEDLINLFQSLSKDPYAFLIYHERYCLMGHEPFLVFKSKGTQVNIQTRESTRSFFSSDPLNVLKENFLEHLRPYSNQPFFQGGMIGYFGYDLGRMWESIPSVATDPQDLPDILAAFYDQAYLYDRFQKKGMLIAIPIFQENPRQVISKLKILKDCLSEDKKKIDFSPNNDHLNQSFISNFTKEDYLEAIRKAKSYIAQGDIYQVNLSQRFSTTYNGKPFPLFKKLIEKNPAPYASFLHVPDHALLSLSPERFLRIEDKFIQTCPIKGTRPRSDILTDDLALKLDLLNSPKDAAELLMIVDLERNDLGKVCEYGSVHVADAKRIEEHPTVFHLVGTVEGKLRDKLTHFDCLRATFPGGSITGAPKIRAMQIIEELEPTRRNVYTGALGYMGFNGITDLSILIRTLVQRQNQISFQVGSGIVSDSDPESEYFETLAKGKTFFDVLSSKDVHTTSQNP